MNIYHVKRTDGGGGYDTYSDFVIVANSAEEARGLMPHYDGGLKPVNEENDRYGDWVTYDKTSAKSVGLASTEYKEPTLICASFHAG